MPVIVVVVQNPGYEPRMAAAAAALIERAGEIYAEEVREEIQASVPEGRYYLRPGGVVHRASAPGQPPAIETGQLIEGIGTSKVGSGYRTQVGVGSGRPGIDVALEFGTSTMAPRPVWRPALAAAPPQLE